MYNVIDNAYGKNIENARRFFFSFLILLYDVLQMLSNKFPGIPKTNAYTLMNLSFQIEFESFMKDYKIFHHKEYFDGNI